MILSAVLVIPRASSELPTYLFEPVAGVPLLARQILGLRRAGVSQITLLVDARHRPALAAELERHSPRLGEVTLRSEWAAAADPGAPDVEDRYVLLAPVNLLPGRRVYAALTDQLPPPGGLTLGVVSPSPAPPATTPTPPRRWPTAGFGLFSPAAWQDWLQWVELHRGALPDTQEMAGLLAEFAASPTAGPVAAVPLQPGELISICSAEERAAATVRLINLENDSPLSEGILEKAWNRRLARMLLPWVLAQPISPNQITLFSFLVGLLAVWGFAHGSYAAAAGAGLLLPLILVLDCLDGMVARLKFQESPLGALLDVHGDSILNLLLFLGMATGCYRSSGRPLYLFLGALILMGYGACWQLARQLPFSQPLAQQPAAVAQSRRGRLWTEAVSRDFFYIILLMALLRRLDWLVVLLAVGTNIFAWLLYRQQKKWAKLNSSSS